MIKDQLRKSLSQALSNNPAWTIKTADIDYATQERYGDFASSMPMALAKIANQSPTKIADEIKNYLKNDKTLKNICSNIEVVKPGFINFTIKPNALVQELVQRNNSHLTVVSNNEKRVMVEFSSPNIAKPFNVGHLRSTIIGDALARMYRYAGYTVITDNHLGDWGTQYGKLAYAVEQWGDWIKIQQDPIRELFALYVRFHQLEAHDPDLTQAGREYFSRLEKADPHMKALWGKLVSLSLGEFDKLYQQLGIEFDVQNGESFYEPMLADVVEDCKRAGIAHLSDGALLIFYPDDELPPLMIEKSNGTSTYATRDLAGIKYRFAHYKLDKLILEAGNEQQLYFKQVIRAAELLNWVQRGQIMHVGHGLFMLPTGKMSTRKGETIWVSELITEMIDRARDIIQHKNPEMTIDQQREVAEIVALGGLKYNDLSQNRNGNVVYDKDKALSLEGNSAPYLQYTVVRAKSVLEQAGLGHGIDVIYQKSHHIANSHVIVVSEDERHLYLWLTRMNDVVTDALNSHAPHIIATYLYQVAQRFNSFYHQYPILKAEDDIRDLRLLITEETVRVITTGLQLLGIKIPDRM